MNSLGNSLNRSVSRLLAWVLLAITNIGYPFAPESVQEPTFWQQYKYYVIAGLSIITAQCLLIGLLIFERQKRRSATRGLRKSEEQFRLLFENSKDAILIADNDGDLVQINQAACTLLGYPKELLMAMKISGVLSEISPDEEFDLQSYRRQGYMIGEWSFVRPDGELRTSEYTACLFAPGLHLGILRDVTERRRAEEELRELTARLLKLQDEERRRIARELHDVTAQNLFAIHSHLSLLIQGRYQPEDVDKKLADCHRFVSESLKEIRTFSYLLHPPMLEHAGLADTLQWYVDGFIKRSDIYVDLDVSEDIDRLPPDIEIAFFRIVQESLANVQRHSGSSTASINLLKQSGQLVLRIKDAGQGIALDDRPQEITKSFLLGVGIPGMRERMRQLGGGLEIESSSEGTIVTATVPVTGAGELVYDSYPAGR
jgi:PAS domain S-box-containing protein